MSPATIFQIHLVLGYVPWVLCFSAYVCSSLRRRAPEQALGIVNGLGEESYVCQVGDNERKRFALA